jgi:hypothetical protein
MKAQHLLEPQENEDHVSLWREGGGWFSIVCDGQTVQLSPEGAEEVAMAILKNIQFEGLFSKLTGRDLHDMVRMMDSKDLERIAK